MHRLLVDEDLPRTLAGFLRAAEVDAVDVLASGDLGFGNVLRFPLGSHCGMVVVRYPNALSVHSVNEAVSEALRRVSDTEILGALLIVEPGRIRLLRRSPSG